MKILFAGDTHGNQGHLRNVFARACRVEADVIFQLGDYGWGWQHVGAEDWFSLVTAALVKETGIPFYWIDGNHENHDEISERFGRGTGVHEYLPGVHYVSRATMLTFDGRKFLCCGGAASVDRQYRIPGESWWPGETITEEDVKACGELGRADVVLTHDFPWECDVVDRHLSPQWGDVAQAATEKNRQLVSKILLQSGAKRLYHGHLHIRYNELIHMSARDVVVHGLDCDEKPMRDSTLLLDIDTIPVLQSSHETLLAGGSDNQAISAET